MLFNSIHFVFFFPLVIALYFSIPPRFRWAMLLAASYYFYMCWNVKYILIILFTTSVDYCAGLLIEGSKTNRRRRLILFLSLSSNLGVLFFFKYFNFFTHTVNSALDVFRFAERMPYLHVLLPVGISFYAFQSMSYTIDVYRRMRKAEKHPGYFALYVAYFPQLVAGPIERSTHLLPQLRQTHGFDADRVASGLRQMLWGFFKKIVIADRLGIFVAQVHAAPEAHGGPAVILATYFFAFQIYCDFSGYSDIAIGAARVMGINLVENFKRPYFSKSIQEFWQRWHISLSTWFRDYLYFSLIRRGMSRAMSHWCLFLTFLLSGLWHGAAGHFVFWGALQGGYLVAGQVTQGWRKRMADRWALERYPFLMKCWRVFVTFHLIAFSLVFFRANNMGDALTLLRKLFDFQNRRILFSGGLDLYEMAFAFVCIAFLLAVQLVQRKRRISDILVRQPVWIRWGIYYAGVFAILLLSGGTSAFIYFQF